MEKTAISKATLGRLPQYLEYLRQVGKEGETHTSATAIAKAFSLGEVLVRKDLNTVSGKGKPKLGYVTAELTETLEELLGYRQQTPAVLVGAGKLGKALLDHDDFERYGVRIAAAFDQNDRVLTLSGKIEILPVSRLEAFCRENGIRLGIITVGAGSAQAVCDRMVESGITAIWNFAPCALRVPEGVLLKNENLALSLAHLNNQLRHGKQQEV